MVYAVTLPRDAPVWFDPLDGGVFYVLEGEALPDLGVVHTHADLHWAEPGQGGGGVAHYLRHGPPTRDAALDLFKSVSRLSITCRKGHPSDCPGKP